MKRNNQIRVGSWPGYGWVGNDFIQIFLDALAQSGCEIKSLEKVGDIRGDALDVVILHWAEKVFWQQPDAQKAFSSMRALLQRLDELPKNVKVIWIVHNLVPHDIDPERGRIWPYYMAALTARVDAALTLSPGTESAVRQAFPGLSGKPVSHFWHPSYPNTRLTDEQARAARVARSIPDTARVIGYCGLIRTYKGLDRLVQAFASTRKPGLRLLIAGKVSGTSVSVRDLPEARDPRMIFDLRPLSRREFDETLACCDVFVAPFRSYLHSGSLVHALSGGRPVLTPRTAFSESLQAAVGPEWVKLYDGDLSPALLDPVEEIRPARGQPDLAEFQAERVGPKVTEFIRRVMARR